MIHVNEQNNLIVGTLRKVETFYEFFRVKNSMMQSDFKLAIENFKVKKIYFDKPEEEPMTGTCMKMHDLTLKDIKEDKTEYDGRICVDCESDEKKFIKSIKKLKSSIFNYKDQPYDFVFICDKMQCKDSYSGEHAFYCGGCGIERVK
jgi:hypothetical protein